MDQEIPIVEKNHECFAVHHLEDVAHDLDELRREVRQSEKHTAETIQKIWIRIGILTCLFAVFAPEIIPKIWGLF